MLVLMYAQYSINPERRFGDFTGSTIDFEVTLTLCVVSISCDILFVPDIRRRVYQKGSNVERVKQGKCGRKGVSTCPLRNAERSGRSPHLEGVNQEEKKISQVANAKTINSSS